LLGRLQPDYKSIAEFRRVHSRAVSEAGAELVRLARSVGLVRGKTVALVGSKFGAVSSAKRVRERDELKRYLEQLDAADQSSTTFSATRGFCCVDVQERRPRSVWPPSCTTLNACSLCWAVFDYELRWHPKRAYPPQTKRKTKKRCPEFRTSLFLATGPLVS
jgi:hypothetical protein